MGSSSSRVTQRWAQPKSPNSHADAPHPSDSITPQLPSLSCCLVDGDPPPLHPRPCLHCCPPRGCRRGLDEAPESWQHRRGRLAPQGIACAGNAAPRRYYHSKAAKMSRERLLTPGFVMPWSEPVFFLFRTFDARLFVELLAAGC